MELPRYHRITKAQIRLDATGCAKCGTLHFPPRPQCRSCGCPETTIKRLSEGGVLLSFSEVFRSGGVERGMPYFVGLVQLAEGITLFSQLTDVDRDNLSIGMEVEAVVRRVDELDEGLVFYGYKFRPRGRAGLSEEC